MKKAVLFSIFIFLILAMQSCSKTDNEEASPIIDKPIDIKTDIIDKKWVLENISPVYNCITERYEYVFNEDGTGERTFYWPMKDMMKNEKYTFKWSSINNKDLSILFQDGGITTLRNVTVNKDSIYTTIGTSKCIFHRELTNNFDLAATNGTYLTNRLVISTALNNRDNLDFTNFTVTAITPKGYRVWAEFAYPLTGVSWGIGRNDPHLYLYAVCSSEYYTYSISFEVTKKRIKEKNINSAGYLYYFLIGEVSHTTDGVRSIVTYNKEYPFGY